MDHRIEYSKQYTVWLRNDGYIDASAHDQGKFWRWGRTKEQFTVLMVTNDWPTAREHILQEREAARAAGTWPEWAE